MKYKKLIGLFLIDFLVSLGFASFETYFSVYSGSLSFSGFVFSLILFVYPASKVIFTPFSGAYYDRFGAKTIAVSCLLVCVALAVAYIFIRSASWFIIVRIIQGAAVASMQAALLSEVGLSVKESSRGFVLGNFEMPFFLAISLAPFFGGMIMDGYGFSGIIVFLLICTLLAFGLVTMLIPHLSGSDSLVKKHPRIEKIAVSPKILGLSFFIFGKSFLFGCITVFTPLYVINALKLSGTKTGILLSLSSLVMTFLLMPMGRLSDRVSKKGLVFWGGFAFAIAALFIPFFKSFPALVALYVLLGIFNSVSHPAGYALLFQEGQNMGVGKCVGLFKSSFFCGYALAPLIGGIIASSLCIRSVFIFAGVIELCTIFTFFALHSEIFNFNTDSGAVCGK